MACSAINDSQQPTSPIGFLFWNFCHRLVRYYWCLFVLQDLHKLLLTKFAQSTSRYYFVLQDLHKVLPRTTLCYEACTKSVKVLPTATSWYKSCTQCFPVLLRAAKLAWSISQHNVLQSLRAVLLSTTSYYKAFTHERLWPREVFSHRNFYAQRACTQISFDTEKILYRETFTHAEALHAHAFTQRFFRRTCSYTEAFTHRYFSAHMLLRRKF